MEHLYLVDIRDFQPHWLDDIGNYYFSLGERLPFLVIQPSRDLSMASTLRLISALLFDIPLRSAWATFTYHPLSFLKINCLLITPETTVRVSVSSTSP